MRVTACTNRSGGELLTPLSNIGFIRQCRRFRSVGVQVFFQITEPCEVGIEAFEARVLDLLRPMHFD